MHSATNRESLAPTGDITNLPRRSFLARTITWGAVSLAAPSLLQQLVAAVAPRRGPGATHLNSPLEFQLTGWIQNYLVAVTDQWLKVAPVSNPALLEMFRDQNRQPLREMVPWAGEFAGKYLTSAVQVYRLNQDPLLRESIAQFTRELIAVQAENGYLGPWPKDCQLTGVAPNCSKGRGTWDAWGHYHIMLGLLLWHETSGDAAALAAAQRMADLICTTFAHKRLADTGNSEMNQAPIHSLAILYARTGNERYLRMAEKIRDEFAATDAGGLPIAGDYLEGPLAGKEYFELPLPRWEGLHPVMGLSELALVANDQKCRRAFEKIWWSIARTDRHNNGGFSSAEKAVGDPYNKGAIETCSTVAWIALGVEMLRLTGNSIVADELELSTLNSIVGSHSPSGRWVTYNCPMDGLRRSSTQDLVSQARQGASELSCCSVNGARGLGMISDWALVRSDEGLTLNWYGPGSISAPLQSGGKITFGQETAYPRENRVRVKIGLPAPVKLAVKLRIPHWSTKTTVSLNGQPVPGVEAGRYLTLDRTWKSGDVVELAFDFSLQFWVGEKDYAGKVSIYRGPILLTYDRRYNTMDPKEVPALAAAGLRGEIVEYKGSLPPMLLLAFKTSAGSNLQLCDFASAGTAGTPYRTWLDVTGCGKTDFSTTNPRRTAAVL